MCVYGNWEYSSPLYPQHSKLMYLPNLFKPHSTRIQRENTHLQRLCSGQELTMSKELLEGSTPGVVGQSGTGRWTPDYG